MARSITVPDDTDVTAIVGALRVAAVQYATDAETSRSIQRVREAFLAQARRANELADRIEENDGNANLDANGRDSVDRGELAACLRGGDPS